MNNQTNHNNDYMDSEINFIDIIRMLLKRKKLFIGSFLIFSIISVVYISFFYQPKQQFTSVMKIMSSPDENLSEKFFLVKTVYFPREQKKFVKKYPQGNFFTQFDSSNDGGASGILTLNIMGNAKDQSVYQAYTQAILGDLNQYEKNRLLQRKNLLRQNIKILTEALVSKEYLQKRNKDYLKAVKDNTSIAVDNLAKSLSMQVENSLNNEQRILRQQLTRNIHDLNQLHLSHFIDGSEFIVQSTSTNKPALLIALFMISFFSALLITVFIELIQSKQLINWLKNL